MSKLRVYSYFLVAVLAVISLTCPVKVVGGMMMMKKGGMGGGMGGGGGGVVHLLAAGIVAKLLQEMGGLGKLTMGKGMQQQSMTKYVPVPIFVAAGGHMMMNNGWKGGMMMNSGWNQGMMGGNMMGGNMMGGD